MKRRKATRASNEEARPKAGIQSSLRAKLPTILEAKEERHEKCIPLRVAEAKEAMGQQPTHTAEPELHWTEGILHRGLGAHLHQVNHIALVVEDIGDSLFFYSDIIGFQQIRRPNFDRHGAWLTMGNIELHLIKGTPACKRGQHDHDLIVSHIAIECVDMDGVLARLQKLKDSKFKKLTWRQNLSVPDPNTSRTAKFESHTSSKGKVTQFFLEDPDGYWIELCNCEVLTKFCLQKEDVDLVKYDEGICSASGLMHTTSKLVKWKNHACDQLHCASPPSVTAVSINDVDTAKLDNLNKRRATYGDICQGYSEDEIRDALANAGNDVPTAIQKLTKKRAGQSILMPPSFLHESSDLVKGKSIVLVSAHSSDWGVVV